jgi:broad specificity phosphatase PhoE
MKRQEKSYYVFRHALATKSEKGYGKEIFSAKILPEGVEPIKKIGRYLKKITTDYNVSSEFLRCRQTVEIISHINGKQFSFDARLSEYYLETFDELLQRVKEFLEEIESSTYKAVVICTHGAVIAILKNLIIKGKASESDLLDFPKTGVLIEIKGERIKEIDCNI